MCVTWNGWSEKKFPLNLTGVRPSTNRLRPEPIMQAVALGAVGVVAEEAQDDSSSPISQAFAEKQKQAYTSYILKFPVLLHCLCSCLFCLCLCLFVFVCVCLCLCLFVFVNNTAMSRTGGHRRRRLHCGGRSRRPPP